MAYKKYNKTFRLDKKVYNELSDEGKELLKKKSAQMRKKQVKSSEVLSMARVVGRIIARSIKPTKSTYKRRRY